jgi:hypothetical protein
MGGRFYVHESDHRRLWNEAMAKIDNNEHRIVQSRTQIWGKAPSSSGTDSNKHYQPIDLLSGSVEFNTNNDDDDDVTGGQQTTENDNVLSTTGDPFHDFFAPTQFSSVGESGTNTTTTNQNGTQESEVSKDLIKF